MRNSEAINDQIMTGTMTMVGKGSAAAVSGYVFGSLAEFGSSMIPVVNQVSPLIGLGVAGVAGSLGGTTFITNDFSEFQKLGSFRKWPSLIGENMIMAGVGVGGYMLIPGVIG